MMHAFASTGRKTRQKKKKKKKRLKLYLGWVMTQREGGKRIKLQTKLTKKRKQRSFKPNQENMNMSSVLENTRFGGSDSTTKV